jgi:hypothetical protein
VQALTNAVLQCSAKAAGSAILSLTHTELACDFEMTESTVLLRLHSDRGLLIVTKL